MERKTKQFETPEGGSELLRPRGAVDCTEERMICKFKRVTSKFLGPVNEWAKREMNSGGDATHFGFVTDTSEVAWVFPLRRDGSRLCIVFNLDGSVKLATELRYTDEQIERGYKVI